MLWDDLERLCADDTDTFHFMGPIVTVASPGMPQAVAPYTVIDGQQRIITLTLLLAALRDYVKEDSPKSAEELEQLYLVNKFQEGDGFYKVLPSQTDRKEYQSIIKGVKTRGQGPVQKAYQFFFDKIANAEGDSEGTLLNAESLKRVSLLRLTLVSITLDNNDNPYLIFEALNYKGKPLTQADLVRNYFFMGLAPEQHEEVYQSTWLPLQKDFESAAGENKYSKELTDAFWSFIRKDGQNVNYNQVYQALKLRLERSNVDLLDSLGELAKFAEYYRRIRFPQEEPEPRLQKWFNRALRLDFTAHYPFLLNLYDLYEVQEGISLDEFESILRYVESYFVRRSLMGIPTNTHSRLFNGLYNQLADHNNLVESTRETLENLQEKQRWPDEEELRKGLMERNIYPPTINLQRAKLILESIEESLGGKEKVDPSNPNITIEHIMPQTLTDDWRRMLGTNAEEVHALWLHKLGNLTITGYNAEMGNKSFGYKQKIFRDSGALAINKHFNDLEVWNEEEIEIGRAHV